MKPSDKKVTLDDLSDHLQLSKFSVSRALGGRKGVSEATRQLVLNAARELGYDHPGLRNTHTNGRDQIHLIIPRNDAVQNPFWMEVVSGAEEEARRRDFTLVTAFAENEDEASVHAPEVRGIILAGRRSRGLLESYLATDVPVVLIGYPRPGERLDSVHIADWEGGVLIGRHLGELGHRRVAFITDAPEDEGRRERLRGCREGIGNDGTITEVFFDPETEPDSRLLHRRLLDLSEQPTALICASEAACFNALLALGEAGARVPEDFSVVTSGSTTRVAPMGFDVTALRAPMSDLGSVAVDLVHKRINENSARAPVRIALSGGLSVKRTTSAPKTS